MELFVKLQVICENSEFFEFWGFKWSPILVYVYNSVVLGCGRYRKLVCTAYVQQQLLYNTDQVLHVLATSQLFALVLACLLINGFSWYFREVASCLTRGMTTL